MRAPLRVAMAVVVLLSASPTFAADAAPTPPPERRHSSGIVLLGPFDIGTILPIHEPLARAWSDAWALAEDNPDAFGFPWEDRAARELVVSVANPAGEAIAREWIRAGATRKGGATRGGPSAETAKPGPDLAAPQVPVRLRAVDRTFAQLLAIQNSIGPGLAGIPGAESIWVSGPDAEHNRVIYETDRLNDAMLVALAARFGTEAVAVRIDPNMRQPMLVDGAPRAEVPAPVDPLVAGAVAAGVVVLVGLALVAVRRRRIPG